MPSAQTEIEQTDPLIGATDHLEQVAEEVAHQKQHPQVTDDDRREAYERLRKTAPPAKSGPPTPEQS